MGQQFSQVFRGSMAVGHLAAAIFFNSSAAITDPPILFPSQTAPPTLRGEIGGSRREANFLWHCLEQGLTHRSLLPLTSLTDSPERVDESRFAKQLAGAPTGHHRKQGLTHRSL